MREHLWGKQPPGSVPAASQLAPDFLDLAYAYLFGEVYYDATLSLQQRSVCTVAVLTALGREPQLRVHIRAALNVGLTKQQVVEVITHVAAYAGLPATLNALGVAKAVFDGG
jgi:4-carboxymuconolactone decarboxylase